MFKKYPIVAIKWEDHSGDAGWVDNVAADEDIVVAETVGFLVDESDKAYHVMDTKTSDGGYGGYSLILKACVINYKVLRKSY